MHDFGAVGQLETLRAEFRLVNHFPNAVAITELLKGCSCAMVSISQERVEPGQSATLAVEWQTGSRRGKATEVVTLYAMQENVGPVALQVRLTAFIEPDVRCEPPEVRFERSKPGTVVLRFTPGRMPDARIQSVHSTVTALQTTIDPEGGTVTVRYDPTMADGLGEWAAVVVQTTSPKEPWVRVPVAFAGIR